MDRYTRAFMEGAGSVFNIMPANIQFDFRKLIPLRSEEEMMAEAWRMTGDALRQAMGEVEREQQNKREAKAEKSPAC